MLTPLQDLLQYNTINKKWTEIVVDGMVPPPLHYHTITQINEKKILLYGGISNNVPQSSLYSFDLRKMYF